MLLNYLKLSFRLLIRNPFFTFINVTGLSVGFVAFFMLWQYSSLELKSDQYHKDYDHIARICAHWRWMEKNGYQGHYIWGNIMTYQTGMIFSDFSQIEEHCRYINRESFNPDVVGLTDRLVFAADGADESRIMFEERNVISADPNLFEFFTMPLIRGNAKTVLKRANSVVLSQATATRYFGNADPVNRLLKVNDSTTLVVTGIFENLPHASHLYFDIVISNVGRENQWDDPSHPFSWTETYIKIADPGGFEKMTELIKLNEKRYWDPVLKIADTSTAEMFLQPLKEIAFGDFGVWPELKKSRPVLIMLKVISIVILLMAWINYMNLTVSRIAKRSKEISARKISGAHAGDFIGQFLTESLLINGIALAMAFTVVQLIREPFQLIFEMPVPDFKSIPFTIWIAVFIFVVSGVLVTALYPAYLSLRYNPRQLMVKHNKATLIRFLPSALTTFQYATAFVLISWIFIAFSQLSYLLDQDFLKKNRVIIVEGPIVKPASYSADVRSLMMEIRKRTVSTFSSTITGHGGALLLGIREPLKGQFEYYSCIGGVDETFVPFFEIKILAGRNFRTNEPESSMLVSQLAAFRLGFEKIEDAIGSNIDVHELGKTNDENETLQIVGVYEDFPLGSKLSSTPDADKQNARAGHVMIFSNTIFAQLTPDVIEFQVDQDNFKQTLSFVEGAFNKIFPGSIFNWHFLGDYANRAYHREEIIRNQIVLFTGLAILISCLGLLGMITNKAEEKIKEIGIRKVLGASIRQLSYVLLNSTSRQILAAVVLSLPIAYYLGQNYLQRYTDQISMQWWHFVSPVIMLMLIMLATVAVVLYKAAKANPVEALKYE